MFFHIKICNYHETNNQKLIENSNGSKDPTHLEINLTPLFPFHRYFFSWRDPGLQGVEEDWLGARNYCRKRCMDSVSLETSNENEWIKKRLVDDKVRVS